VHLCTLIGLALSSLAISACATHDEAYMPHPQVIPGLCGLASIFVRGTCNGGGVSTWGAARPAPLADDRPYTKSVGTLSTAPGIVRYLTFSWPEGGGEFRFIAFDVKLRRCPLLESIRFSRGGSVIYSRPLCKVQFGGYVRDPEYVFDLSNSYDMKVSNAEWTIQEDRISLYYQLRYRLALDHDEDIVTCEVKRPFEDSLLPLCW
jgi:hypothetical protein